MCHKRHYLGFLFDIFIDDIIYLSNFFLCNFADDSTIFTIANNTNET